MSYGNSDCFSNSDMLANCNGDIKHKELNSNHNENEKFLPHDNHKRKDPRNGMIEKRKEKKEKQIAMNNTMDVVVHVHETDGCSRRWTNREKYLLCLCSLLFFACVAFVVVAFIRDSNHVPVNYNVCISQECIKTATLLMDAMDTSVDPCADFFQYACGMWNKKHIIPEDKSSFNTFEKMLDDLQIQLKGLLEDQPNDHDTEATLKAKTLYKSCLNTSQIDRIGDKPLRLVLDRYGGWPVASKSWDPDTFDLELVLGRIRKSFANVPSIVDAWVAPDDKNSTQNIIQIDQPTLGMPSREYYVFDPNSEYIESYLRFMINVAIRLGADEDTAVKEMQEVFDFETKIANITKPLNERHDTGAIYKKLTLKELIQLVPKFDWMKFFSASLPVTIDETEELVTYSPEYLVHMTEILEKADKRVIANYVIWRLVMSFVPEMTGVYSTIRSDYNKILLGVTRDKPQWQKCVEYVNDRMGMALGALFIRDNFDEESKETALKMIHNIRDAFNELLEQNQWMDKDTKEVAKEKADSMNERIGYPDFIKNADKLNAKYEELHFDEDHYFENYLQVELYEAKKTLKDLRNAVDKNLWDQDPAVANAFYNPNTNDIVFPAGILQPPFYSARFPKSLNFGGIGVVIGHEITHGFDDKGRQYDKEGNMKQWWKNETIEAFRHRAQCIIDQYSGYKLEQIDKNIDGRNTQGENIADNGGLKQAYRAYRKWVKANGEDSILPGLDLSHDQLFFLNYAQIWCGNMRDEEALQKIRTSVHSPGAIRVLGPLSNSVDFSKAYNCPIGSRMNPVKKCSVW
ncbi:neprilysin-1-like [Mytilus trossulus]|uniref:neprilysin-1-like n=1 Tax=Mytilus trossulus TaxID=6551 RepID=UPI003007BCBA